MVFDGGIVSFYDAAFSGGTVDLSAPRDWSMPLSFGGVDPSAPPAGLRLPPQAV
ncbi:hypothetical protein [Actinomadura hibisca]|uniref:hypothetical protein n=1 Tax=Actinomadura hibisca TaxID=68565 RepID=UPI000B15A78D|nr:hypothetical protein [Actinomadura hibisca]